MANLQMRWGMKDFVTGSHYSSTQYIKSAPRQTHCVSFYSRKQASTRIECRIWYTPRLESPTVKISRGGCTGAPDWDNEGLLGPAAERATVARRRGVSSQPRDDRAVPCCVREHPAVAPDKLTCAATLTAVELTATKPFTPGMVPSSPEI